jgi:hypothetical protein
MNVVNDDDKQREKTRIATGKQSHYSLFALPVLQVVIAPRNMKHDEDEVR